jgi:hypothetical protein
LPCFGLELDLSIRKSELNVPRLDIHGIADRHEPLSQHVTVVGQRKRLIFAGLGLDCEGGNEIAATERHRLTLPREGDAVNDHRI